MDTMINFSLLLSLHVSTLCTAQTSQPLDSLPCRKFAKSGEAVVPLFGLAGKLPMALLQSRFDCLPHPRGLCREDPFFLHLHITHAQDISILWMRFDCFVF